MSTFINAKYYLYRALISIFILMLLAGTALSATYYVKNGGSDSADGLSDANAWASISKVNNKDLSAGDIVLFKKDSTWSDTLIPKSSGSAVSPIIFGAYGTGAVPVININYNSSKHRNLYVNGKSNIQIRGLAFLNGTSEGSTLYGNVEINNSSSIVLENIVVSGSFCKTAVLIANSSHDISVRNSTVETTSFPGSTNAEGAGIQIGDFSNFNTCYNVVITGCEVKNNSGAGIVVFESYQNSIFENNVHGNGSAGIWVGGASGSYSHDNIIEKNRVYENCQYQDDAFGIDLYRVGDNNTVRYNLVHDQYDTVYNPSSHTIFNSHLFGSGGIRFDGNNTMSTLNVNGNIAHNNIVYNEYQGFQVIHINNIQIFNNTIYNNKIYSNTSYSSTGISVLSNYPSVETHTSNTIVKNNAIYGKYWMVNDAYSSGTSFNNNVYFCTYDGTHIYFSHNGSGVDTFAGWKSATGYDSLSTFEDPDLVSATADFYLQSGSPCINGGTLSGISAPSPWRDYDGKLISGVPDIGAYEYDAPTSGSIYYVDAVNGSDSNNGTSTGTPWKTIDKVNEIQGSLAAGNKVLFKRGQTFRKTKHNWTTHGVLTVKKSGTSGNPIVYGAYGSGPKPIISGSNTVGAWSLYSGNIWSASWVTDGTWDQPTQVFMDGQRGNKRASTMEVTSPYDWYWNSNTLYLYSANDPDTAFVNPGIEVTSIYNDSGCVSISSESYVVIKDLQFERSRGNMLNLTYGTNNVTIENCSFYETDPDYSHGAAAIMTFTYSDTSASPASSCDISNCDFGKRTGSDLDDQKWAPLIGIRIKGRDNRVHDNIFSHNAIENESSYAAYCAAIEVNDAHGITQIYNNHIYHNAGCGIMVHGDDDGDTFRGLYFYSAGDVFRIYNNTIAYSALAGIQAYKTRAATGHAGALEFDGSNGAVGHIYNNDVSHCNRLANDVGANGIKGCGIHINNGPEVYYEADHPFIKWYVYQNRSYLHSSPANPKGEDTGGIALDLNCSGTEAFRNICYNNQGVGIYILSADGCKVYDNIFFGNDEGISVGGQAAPETAYNNQIFNNVCFKNYNGDNLGQDGIYDAEITIGDRIDGTKIKNNIFYGDSRSYVYRWWLGTSIEVSHNIVYNPGGNIEPYHTSWSSWNSLGFDTVGSLNTNPSFEAVNYSVTLQGTFPYITYPLVSHPDTDLNFNLKSNSVAINAGTTEGLSLPSVWMDYAGTSVPQSARPDMGAYEQVLMIPSVPASLTNEASENTNKRIRLSWTDNSDNENGFLIYGSSNGVSYVLLATAEAGVNYYVISGLSASTNYYFKVSSFNGSGVSGFSNVINTTTYSGPAGVKSSYYVDPTSGNNANSGSQASPWKTLSRLADYSFVSGDAVYLKRGGVWREELFFPSSGSAAEPIILDAYGSGAKPLILGSEVLSSWEPYDSTSNLWTSGRLYLVRDYNCTNVGFIRLTQETGDPVLGTNIAQVVNSISDVNSNGKFYYVTHEATANGNTYGEVVIYCDDPSGPLSKWPDMEVGVRSRGIQILGVSYVTIRNIDARYGTAGGLRIGDGSHHIVLESCEASYSGGTVTGISNIRAGDVVKFDRGVHDIEVRGCRISQTYDFGFSVETYDGNNDLYNITFESNTLDKCGGGIGINAPYYNPTSTSSIHDLHIKNNQITNTGYGWSSSTYNSGKGMAIYLSQSDQAINQRIYNIHIYGNTIDKFQLNGIHMNDGGIYHIYKNTIKNGTLDYQVSGDTNRVQNAALLIHGGNSSGDFTRETSARIYDNLIYGNAGYGLTVLNNSPYSGTPEVFNNTFYGNGGVSYPSVNIYYNSIGGVRLRNNIIYSANSRVIEVVSSSPYFSSNYNCFYGLNGTVKVYYSSADYNFSDYRASLGQDANSILQDPSFEAAGTNFSLRSVSQAVNAGTTEGLSIPSSWTDYAGTGVPQGTRPDIGAYEYSTPVITGTVKVSGSGAAIQWAGVYLLNASSELVSYAVTDSSGNFSIDAASMEGYLFVSPPTSQNGQGYWVYQYQPRFYYKPAASNSGIDIRLPQASTFIIEGRDGSNNLMDVASFEALRANVFSQYISFVNMNDQIQPAMYWQVTNSDGRAIPALMIDSSQTGGPFAVNVLFWQTASHGKIMLKADNDGSGFTLPSAGQATIINLNTELLKTVKKEMVNRTSHYNTYIPGDPDIALISSVSNLDDAIDLRDRLEYKAAQAAINVIRKGSVEITAKDLSGNVLQNCTLEVVQTSHQFMFGAFEGTSRYTFHTFEADTDRKYAYSKAMEAGLGDITAVLPAWSATAGYGKTIVDQTWGITSLKDLGYKVKFHGTLWFNLLMIPSSEVSNDPVTIASHNRSYQDTIFGYFGDTGSIWESMNEPSFSNEINLSREAMISVLADSAATLNTNNDVLVNSPHEFDYGFKYAQYNLDNTLKTDYKLTYSDFLSRANISNIDIIGLQFYPGFHMDPVFGEAEGPAMPPYWLVDTVNRYSSSFGKKIHITEFSVPSNHDAEWKTGYWKNNWDTASQAEYVDRIFTLMYGTSSVDSIIWWDMLESESYLKYGGLLDASKNAKPAYDSVKNLIKGSWTTTGEATTANNGKTTVNGFGGRYSISRIKLGQATTIENPGITFYVTEEASGSKEVVIPVYTLTATSGAHGTITPSGQVCVLPSGSKNFVVTPEAGYRISGLRVDGISVGTPSAYSFTGVNSSHTIEAVFTLTSSNHLVISSSNSGGSIVPNGAISVASGESQNFVITPESGYYIVNVAIDGTNVGPITNYTFSNVTGDHSISATFNNNWSRIYYVDSSSGSNTNTGTSETKAWQAISKVNEMAYKPGDSVKFKSGQTFAGSLNIYQSGTAVSPITFDAYSTGAKPVIDATGQQMGINIISASNVHIKNLDIKNATHPAGLSAGVAGNNSSDIVLDTLTVHDCRGLAGIYFYDTNTRITVKNSLVYNTKAVSDDARYAGIFGSGILMGGTDGQSNSNYHYILNNTSYGNANVGISVGNGSNNTISGNAVYDNGDCGIGLYGLLSSSNIVERNSVYGNCQYKDDRSGINLFRVGNSNIVRYNKTHSQYDTYNDVLVHGINTPESSSSRLGTCGIRFDGGDSGVTTSTGNIVHTNLMTGEGDAYQVYNFASTQFFNNTIYNSKRFGILLNGSYATNAIVKNNIVSTMDGSSTAGSYKHLIMVSGATSYNINNNLYFPDGSTMFNLNETKTNFNSWKASQRDINSMLADPKFVSIPSANFALQNTSSAIDLGTTEGMTLPSPWQDITGSTVPYAGTRPDAGAYESSVVVVSNTSPVMAAIGNKTTNEAQTLAFTVSAADSDGDTVTYEGVTLPSGATFNTTSGAFSWTPTYSQSGTYNPTFIARDGRGGSSQESITITVNNVNRAPVLTRIGGKTTNEAQTLTFTVSGTDEDGSALTYTMTGTPSGASFNTSTRLFIWTPSYSQSGSYTVTFEVSDGSLSSSETVGITVNNVPRTFVITAIAGTGGSISPSGSVSVTEGNSQAFTITGNAGYSISNVLVDGSSQGAVGTYTFSNVTAVHTIEASFSMTLPSAPSGVTASAASVSQINLSWTDNANNEDGYRIQRSPNGTSSWTTIATVGAVTSYNNTGLSPHTTYYYRVYSYNGSGVSAYSNTANATTSNSDPSLTAIGSKTTNEAQTLTFTVSATDADSDTVTYEALNLPTGATFNTTSGAFSWVPSYSQSGTYSNVTFKARDIYGGLAQETITITVTNVNRRPVLSAIGSKGVNENSALSFTVSGTDEDGSALTYSATSLPSGASFNTSTRVFSWTPSYSQAGVYTPTFTVSDGSLTSSETITITVTNVNRRPVLSAIGSKGVNENSALSFTVSGTDEDGSALTYSATSLPSGASFNTSTRVFSWTPSYSQAGVYTPTFTVSDGSLTSSETITITVTNVNRAPVLGAIGSKGVNENSALTFTVSGTDEDGSALTYSATSLPSGASFNTSTRVFSWTPSYSQSGVYTPTFTVSDGSLTSSETITITVTNVNRAPVLNAIGSKGVNENSALSFTLVGSDADGNSLTYTMTGTPSGASLNTNTGAFSWTPTYSQSGSYSVTFGVTDGSLTATETVTITVNNVNRRPVLSAIGSKGVNENSALSFTVSGTDEDGSALTYSATSLPSGASFNTSTRVFSWTPSYSQSGVYTPTFTVSDGSLTSSETITITVTNVNRAPVANAKSVTVVESTTTQIVLTGSDPDGTTVTYSIVSQPSHGSVTTTATGLATYIPTQYYSGADSFTFRVYDGVIYSTNATVSINVSTVNNAPVASPQTVNTTEDATAQVQLTGTDPDGDTITYSIVSQPSHGSVTTTATGLATYIPANNYNGADSFTFKVSDGNLDSTGATVSIIISSMNDVPVAVSSSISVTQDASVAIILSATDADGDSLEYIIVSGPSHGVLNGSGANRIYTPASGYFGADSFTFKASDGVADSNAAETNITIVEKSATGETVVSIAEPAAMPFTDVSSTVIAANWTGGSNPDGTLYYCENVTAGTNSGWITSTKFISRGLSSEQTYEFRVKAKNTQGSETAWISLGTQKTKGKRRFKSIKTGDHKLLPGDIVSSKLQLELEIDAEGIEIEEVNIYVDGIKTSGTAEIKKDIKISAVDEIDIKYVPEQTLTLGEHSIRIEALDTAGDIYEESISGIKVLSSDNKSIQGAVLPYPNPYDSNAGELKVSYTLTTDMDIAVYIFDITGKLVSKRDYVNGAAGGRAGYNEITWDGKDIFGSKVENDIYLIRIVDKGTGKLLGRCKVMVLKK